MPISGRVVTNPGSNLPEAMVEYYGLTMSPQQIVVDDVQYDTRENITHGQIDNWIRGAKQHPYVLGTSALQYTQIFEQCAKAGETVCAVMTSKKIIPSHTAAMSAAASLRDHPRYCDTHVSVIDSMVTDVGAGIWTILAAEALRAGKTPDEVSEMCRLAAPYGLMMVTVVSLDYLVKGGRASSLRAFAADLFRLRPILAFVDGEPKLQAKYKAGANRVEALTDFATSRIPKGTRVWVGIAHGGVPDDAAVLEAALCDAYRVEFRYLSPLAPSIYLHLGHGSLGAYVLPLEHLRASPPAPPLSFTPTE